MWQIANQDGFLPAPIRINDLNVGGLGGALPLGQAERADVIVDFTRVSLGTSIHLLNLGPDEPFGGFPTPAADPDTTGQVMEFRVVAATSVDTSTPPPFLRLPAIAGLTGGAAWPVALLEVPSAFFGGPAKALLGTFDPMTGTSTPYKWEDAITENPAVGTAEVWELYNFTEDAHPIHIHEIHLQVVDRQALDPRRACRPVPLDRQSPGRRLQGHGHRLPRRGHPRASTVRRFGLFVWHCHIVSPPG